MFSPVHKVRTHEQVLDRIQEKILGGELPVGTRLPSERDLVDALGVGRGAVREALRVLEALGVLDDHAVIAARPDEPLGTLLRLHVALGGITVAEVTQVAAQLQGLPSNGLAAALVQALDGSATGGADDHRTVPDRHPGR